MGTHIHIHLHDGLDEEIARLTEEIEKKQDQGLDVALLIRERDRLITLSKGPPAPKRQLPKEVGLARLAMMKAAIKH